jgi:hypothetical protein
MFAFLAGGSDVARPSSGERHTAFELERQQLQIRMVAGSAETMETEEILVAGACNHPNCLVLPFKLELIRLAAWTTFEVIGYRSAIASG